MSKLSDLRESLRGKGLYAFEVKALTSTIRTKADGERVKVDPFGLFDTPYMKSLIRSRQLFRTKMTKKGEDAKAIRHRVLRNYKRQKQVKEGKFDPWQLVRDFEEDWKATHAFESKPKAGSHHKGAISKGKVQEQKARHQDRERQKRLMSDRQYGSLRQLAPGRFEVLDASGKKTGEKVWNPETRHWEDR